MKLKKIDVFAAINYVASGGLAVAFATIGDAAPAHAKQVLAVGAVLTGLSGLLVRLFNNPTDKPATAIVQNAPVVPPGTQPACVEADAIGVNSHKTAK